MLLRAQGLSQGAWDSSRQQRFPQGWHSRWSQPLWPTCSPSPPAPQKPAPAQGGLGDPWPALCFQTERLRQGIKGSSCDSQRGLGIHPPRSNPSPSHLTPSRAPPHHPQPLSLPTPTSAFPSRSGILGSAPSPMPRPHPLTSNMDRSQARLPCPRSLWVPPRHQRPRRPWPGGLGHCLWSGQ